jgi:hypothetical protein
MIWLASSCAVTFSQQLVGALVCDMPGMSNVVTVKEEARSDALVRRERRALRILYNLHSKLCLSMLITEDCKVTSCSMQFSLHRLPTNDLD